ncbi:MAG: helicase-related protein [Chloroflexales bacterium]
MEPQPTDLLDLPLDYWQRRAIDFLRPFFSKAQRLISISTGFFSIQGYDLLRPYLEGKHVRIMVGYDERSRQDLLKALIDEIMDDLARWHENRRAAVEMLVAAMRSGNLRILEARTRLNDHAKVFIFDAEVAISGSTNVTRNGLLSNFEGNLGINKRANPERVVWWEQTFESLWNDPQTTDITDDLLRRLEAWLLLRRPWDIYLKTMQALVPEDKAAPPRSNYKLPTEFQMVVIQRALRQIATWHGAMIVASTGLGKTIMGTHIAYELQHNQSRIMNVIVFAPKHLKTEWRRRLRSAGVGTDSIFTRSVLDLPERGGNEAGEIQRMLEALQDVDERWLIIVDESQYFRHHIRTGGEPRLAHSRLQAAVKRTGCAVLILTATPLATSVEDLQSQLSLLPHTAQPRQPRLPGFQDGDGDGAPWTVNDVAELMHLPVTTVMNTPYVAQYYAINDEDGRGDYVLFGEERRYIPRIHIRRVPYPMIEEDALERAVAKNVLQHKPLHFKRRGRWGISTGHVERQVALARESSPLALRDVLEQVTASVSDGGYKLDFTRERVVRRMHLRPVLRRLEAMRPEDDQKLMRLYALVRSYQAAGRKVLVFVERLMTAVYLEQALHELTGSTRIACTIRDEGLDAPREKRYVQKDYTREVAGFISGFAPRSNLNEDGTEPEDLYDILITTDAYSEGANLQDASVVISYDLAWTPDKLVQRVGRILRFWTEPRSIDLLIFAREKTAQRSATEREDPMDRRLRHLTSRAHEAEQFTEIPILPEDARQFDSLRGLSSIVLENVGELTHRAVEDDRFEVSTFLNHLTALRKHQKEARQIPDDIYSALATKSYQTPHLFVLLQWNKSYEWLLYNVDRGCDERISEDVLLDRISCEPNTLPAEVDAHWIETCRERAIGFWCDQKQISAEERSAIKHVCTLYLSPQREVHDLFSGDRATAERT